MDTTTALQLEAFGEDMEDRVGQLVHMLRRMHDVAEEGEALTGEEAKNLLHTSRQVVTDAQSLANELYQALHGGGVQ